MTLLLSQLSISNFETLVAGTVGLTITYIVTVLIYNVFFHPLRHYPGPKLWAATRIPHSVHQVKGILHYRVAALHEKYGDVVRVAPNELSYICADSWNDIYGSRTGMGGQLKKNQVLVVSAAHGIITTPSDADHRRMRQSLSGSFSDKALREQEPLVMQYIDALMDKLKSKSKSGPIDILSWYNCTTFDIIGDLTYGESFDSLNTHTDWIEQFTDYIECIAIMGTTNYYKPFSSLLRRLMPERIQLRNLSHRSNTYDKLARRLALKEERPDFISHVLPKYQTPGGFSKNELRATCSVLTLAGSETTATLLAGVTYYLLRPQTSPHILAKLKAEIRGAFVDESEITMQSVNLLTYQLAVLDEALRVFPPVVAASPRVTGKDGAVIAGKFVPADTNVSVHQYSAYHSPRNFSRPDDFIPERWLGEEGFEDDKKAVLQPFHVGPRNCIGRTLAYAEMRVILARLIWGFDLELMEDCNDWPKNFTAFGIWQKKPLMVKLTPLH